MNLSNQLLNEREIPELMQAAQEGRVEDVRRYIYGGSTDVTDRTGRTAFSWAATFVGASPGDNQSADATLQFLLDRGADPNLCDDQGETPMHWAAKEGNFGVVGFLLDKHVFADMPDSRGRTPLSRAAEAGHSPVVALLLERGEADPDFKDGRGRTPLSWAAENWRFKSAETLVDLGASVGMHDKEGQIPLWWFINNQEKRRNMDQPGSEEEFQKWLTVLGPKNGGVEPMTKARRTFLSWACERGDEKLVTQLLQTTWADPNSIDRYRKTPLIYALEWNHYEIADLLIKGNGAETDIASKKDVISLRIMIQESRSRVLRVFLERYDINLGEENDYNSISFMRMALGQGDRAIVTALLEHNASIQELENSDWFGPCSISKPFDTSVLATGNTGYSIPIMRMKLQESDRQAYTKLMDQRVRELDLEDEGGDFIKRKGWLSVAVDICALKTGSKTVHWIEDGAVDRQIEKLPKTSDETHLILFRENHRWRTYYQMTHLPNELLFSLGNKSPCRTFTLSLHIHLSMKNRLTGKDDYNDYEYRINRTIEWTMQEVPSRAIHYFSNLPSGQMPQNDLEFVQLFIQTWREDWAIFCRDARRYLGRLRSHQLTARGMDGSFIDAVADNMRQWTQIQDILQDQLSQARRFAIQYQKFSEARRFSEQINEAIDQLDQDVSSQIDKLEQTVRDLLQIEFAWVSINEAHRSTSIATSMKRVTWLTFIFLPLTFASSLFGMNIDLLQDNPSWRWFILVGGVLLLLTLFAWVFFKFTKVEPWVESKLTPPRSSKVYLL